MCPNCDNHVIPNRHLGCWVFSLRTPAVSCRRPCVWIWQGGPKFMWRGTGVDTHHYSEAPGSRMNITHSPHPASPTDGLVACWREGLSCFPSLIDSGGSPSIKSDRLSPPLNPAQQLFGKAEESPPTWELTHTRLLYMIVVLHIIGYKDIQCISRALLLISHKSQAANTRELFTWLQTLWIVI